jgi:hypothetical protein
MEEPPICYNVPGEINFGAIWKDTYGIIPEGSRSELAKDFVAEQYDGD